MYFDETRYDWDARGSGQSWNPYAYGTASDPDGTNDGEDLWENLVSRHNVAFVFSGHVLGDGTGRLTSVGADGNVVHQLLANYQSGVAGSVNGGNGFLRLMEVMPDGHNVRVRTYSPFTDTFKTESDQYFHLVLCGGSESEAPDVDSNRVADGCEPDCNSNGSPDAFDIATETSSDANENGIPDECDLLPAFLVSPESGVEPLEVTVDAGGSRTQDGYEIVSYEWDFGDEASGEGKTTGHEFTTPGSTSIRLTVRDDRGLRDTVEHPTNVLFRGGDVTPWRAEDVGQPVFPGAARLEDSRLLAFAGGSGIFTTSDQSNSSSRKLRVPTTWSRSASCV